MSIEVTYNSIATVVETLEANVPAALSARRKVTHDQYNTSKSLSGTSAPPAAKVAVFEKPLTAGAASIDLTALAGTNGASVDGTGLRVQVLRFRNKSSNANAMTLAKGASNGYDGLGAAFSVTLPPGGEALLLPNDAGADIGGTNKNLDLSGTLTQVAELEIILG